MPEVISLTPIDADRESVRRFLAETCAQQKKDDFYSKILAKLNTMQINILISHLVDEEDFKTIATRLNLSRTTVHKIYISARLIISEILRPSHGTL